MNLAETKKIVSDLFVPKAWHYWLDFLLSALVGWSFFALVEYAPMGSIWQVIAFVVSAFAFYRALLFIHEISHLSRSSVPGFFSVWNILCGIPMLVPSFLYRGVHSEHHNKKTYGTAEDGEYLSFGVDKPWKIVWYVAQSFLVPIPLVIRFGVLTPLSFFHRGLRLFVMERISALAIDFVPKRSIPTGRDLTDWHWQELACFAAVVIATYCLFMGYLPTSTLTHWYLLMVSMLIINSIRTLAAHRYRNRRDELSFEEQLLDSVNITGSPFFSKLWGPVGLQYHGLHHLFPTMPYHSLEEAHQRLMRELPADSAYRKTVEPSLWSALRTLWRDAQQTRAGQKQTDLREGATL